MSLTTRTAVLLAVGALAVGAAAAQDAPLRLFVDCAHRLCDDEAIRQRVGFVDFVRDIRDADVYALSVAEPTGNGTRVALFVEGRGRLAPLADTLTAFVPDGEPFEVGRSAVTDLLQAGLPRYFAYAGAPERIAVTGRAALAAQTPETDVEDPWRGYSFNVGFGASAYGEQRYQALNLDLFGSVARTTDDVKVRGNVVLGAFTQSFEVPDAETFTDTRTLFRASGRTVWAGVDPVSYAVTGGVRHEPFENVAFETSAAGGFEYSFYPYDQAGRRELALGFEAGLRAVAYNEETVFGEMAEVLPTVAFLGRAEYVEPWGSLFGGAAARQRAFGPLSLTLDVSSSVRLSRGLSLDVTASYAAIRDQRSLRRGEATPEEVLLRLRELGTGYRYSTTIGLSYTFGSPFAGAVNPRFDF